MYKPVQSTTEFQQFNHLLLQSWLEKGFDAEIAEGDTDCFLFSLDDQNWCGTLEIKPFELSTYAQLFDIDHEILGALKIDKMMEIDKLSILQQKRNSGILEEILYVSAKHTSLHQCSHVVALIEPKFFRAIRTFYKLPAVQFGPKFLYKGDMVVPMIIDAKEAKRKFEEQGWYTESEVLQHT